MVYLDFKVFIYAVTHDPTRSKKAKEAIRVLRDV